MKKSAFLLSSLIILAPSLAQADYTNLPQSGIERLPHFAQQHYTPKAKVVVPNLPVDVEAEAEINILPQAKTETPFEEDASKKETFSIDEKATANTSNNETQDANEAVKGEKVYQAPVNTEGYVEIPYTTGDGVIRIETNTVQAMPTIYGYSEDGLPITDFSNKVNHYKAQFIEQNPHLFKAKKP